ncbi:CinA family protein [Microbacterium karelineae]|uniref:CinA family protein n=1 Tax=Microbacterium karelineae TaxID=2654283 RepID=UPI0012EA86C1|nr:CinA family protein [Microbacterium karelineae]
MTAPAPRAGELLDELGRRGWSIGTAESLTGGLVAAAIVDVPGASASMRGGVVAYDTRVKRSLLGVDAALLAAHGPVHPDVALQMARGARRALAVDGADADVGLATTGVAGPDQQGGIVVGTVCVAVSTPDGDRVETAAFDGDRDAIRRAAVAAVLDLAVAAIRTADRGGGE